jgi:hypothetical protein
LRSANCPRISRLSQEADTGTGTIGYNDPTVQRTKTSPPSATSPSTSREIGLSADEVRDYFEVGWIVRPGLFHADEVVRMRTCFDELEQIATELNETGLYGGSYFVLGERNAVPVIERIVWAGGCQRYLLEIGNDPRLTAPCAQLLGNDAMDHLLNQAHFKRPGDGVVFGWHQDIEHRDKGNGTWLDINGRGSFVQTVIALDEMTPDSGPLMFIPGSSQWRRVDVDGHDRDDSYRTTARLAQFHEQNTLAITAKPGDTLFFGPYTVHGSFENTSDRSRRVLINGYASPGANGRDYPGDGAGRRLVVPAFRGQ